MGFAEIPREILVTAGSKGHFLWYFLSCPGRKKVRKEWRRTAVVAFADVNGVLQPYEMAVNLTSGAASYSPTVDNLTYTF